MPDYQYKDLTLNARTSDDGSTLDFYVLLNGVELPIQRLFVHDYREALEEASNAGTQAAQEEQQSS